MSKADRIIKELETLSEEERQKVLDKIKDKYMSKDAIVLNENYTWWDNEEDDIYNEK
jgi:gamma-glutamyl phosphate reductase